MSELPIHMQYTNNLTTPYRLFFADNETTLPLSPESGDVLGKQADHFALELLWRNQAKLPAVAAGDRVFPFEITPSISLNKFNPLDDAESGLVGMFSDHKVVHCGRSPLKSPRIDQDLLSRSQERQH